MEPILSKITAKYQVTIPKQIRDKLKLDVAGVIEWHIDKTGIHVEPVEKPFLKLHGILKTEPGNVQDDIRKAREIRVKRYR